MTAYLPSAYLAGPDVFFPNAKLLGAEKKATLLRRGLVGRFPSDNEVASGPGMAHEIFLQNVALIDKSNILLANIIPFRGPSLDPGTAWEIGYAYAKGLPIICYGSSGTYLQRCQSRGLEGTPAGFDHEGMLIEDFDQQENLMISRCSSLIVPSFEEAAVAAQKLLRLLA